MVSPVFLNFDKVQRPGEISKSDWDRRPTVGWADTISCNFNRGLGDFGPGFDEWADLTLTERQQYNEWVGQMLRRCENIRNTVENRWDDSDDEILNERYTGPIDWPLRWRDDVADLDRPSAAGLRCEANHPCPGEGYWSTPAKAGSRRHFSLGEVMPALTTDYGATIWQWDENQG